MSRDPIVDTLVGHAVAIASRMLQGEIPPIQGARQLWLLYNDLALLKHDLTPFVGLESESDYAPEERAEVEREILAAADRFRARWGP